MINYYLLLKPGIILGNLITVAAGFLLASKGNIEGRLFLATVLGLGLIIASACILNNYIDRFIDKKMERTKLRPFVTGKVSIPLAIAFAIILGALGNLILFSYTNVLTLFIADIGFFIYVVIYSLWKSQTIYGTAIGSVAGAIPPVVGYCAVSNRLDLGAFILFAMLVLWQMPHFFSIALYHLDDYTAAQMPLLPIQKGIWRTKVHMLLYILAFIITSLMLTFFHYTGYLYFSVIAALGAAWLVLCLKGFYTDHDQQWGCQMFRFSLVVITFLSFTIPLDVQ